MIECTVGELTKCVAQSLRHVYGAIVGEKIRDKQVSGWRSRSLAGSMNRMWDEKNFEAAVLALMLKYSDEYFKSKQRSNHDFDLEEIGGILSVFIRHINGISQRRNGEKSTRFKGNELVDFLGIKCADMVNIQLLVWKKLGELPRNTWAPKVDGFEGKVIY